MESSGFDVRQNIVEGCEKALTLADQIIQNPGLHVFVRCQAEADRKQAEKIKESCQAGTDKESCETSDIGISEILLRLKKLYYGRIDSSIASKLELCREYVMQARAEVEAVQPDILEELKKYLKWRYSASEIHGYVNNDESFEVLFNSQGVGKWVFDIKCEHAKKDLIKRVGDLFQGGNADENACMVMIKKQIRQKYSDYAFANGDHFAECAACLNGSGIRSKLQKYWGGGGSYIDSIAEDIWDELKRQPAVEKLNGRDYYLGYMDDLAAFFNISM